MKYFIIPALALITLAGPSAAETREVRDFNAISAAGRFEVEVSIGPTYRVDVSGPDAAHISTYVDNRSLQLRETDWHWFGRQPKRHVRVQITTPVLESLAASRGAEVTAVNLSSDRLSLAASMGGSLTASGRCQELNVSLSMGAELDARRLECADVSISGSMGADARVFASESVSATASMGADIHVTGNPRTRTRRTSMGADVSFN